MKKYLLILVMLFAVGCSNNTTIETNNDEGYTDFEMDDVPFTFEYPNSMEATYIFENEIPIVTVTSPSDPTYYYAFTYEENDHAVESFDEIKNLLIENANNQENNSGFDNDLFFDYDDSISTIQGNDVDTFTITSLMDDLYFNNSLYNIPINDEYSIIAFYSSTDESNESEKDYILETLEEK